MPRGMAFPIWASKCGRILSATKQGSANSLASLQPFCANAAIPLREPLLFGKRPPEERQTHEIGRAHVELQSLMRSSYAVFCLKTNKQTQQRTQTQSRIQTTIIST